MIVKKLKSPYKTLVFIVFFISALSSAGCSSSPSADEVEVTGTVTETLAPTATLVPIPTDTLLPNKVLLYAGIGSNNELAGQLERELSQLAGENGFSFERISEPVESFMQGDIRLVVVLAPYGGLNNLALNNPEVNFLGIGVTDAIPSKNLSIVRSTLGRPDQQGFIAGYLGTVLTNDWRVGVISRGDTPEGRAARNAFLKGVVFFCGLCRPVYPPFYEYPLFYDLSGGASEQEQQAAADFLIGQEVNTIYVFPGSGSDFLFEYLAQNGVNLIGGVTPAETVKNNWIASVQVDISSAVNELWSRIMDGEPGIEVTAPLVITNRNEMLFSPGRQQHVDKVLDELLNGYIDTGIDPLTGEETY
jgi:hypothetical protein